MCDHLYCLERYRSLKRHDHRSFEGYKRGDPLPFTVEEMCQLVEVAMKIGKCYHCYKDLTEENYALDHIQALSVGGTSDLSNFRVICRECNNRKRNMSDDLYHFHMTYWRFQRRRGVI